MLLRLVFILSSVCVAWADGLAQPTREVPAQFKPLKYRLVGPYAGGRVSRACGVPGDPLTYYAATASGGVWKSSDGGLSWKPIFDDQPTSSIGSIAVAPTDPNVVYVGTGEANIRGNASPGAGIFRSTDAGKTWKHVWKQVGQIGTITVDPTNAKICFAAVLGHAFGPNSERGVYRTTDGGDTWKKVCFVNADTGASDVCIDPNNPRIVYAGFWQTRRLPWEHTSGGPGSDLFVSHDGGDTWKSLKHLDAKAKKNGLPTGVWGKVGVAVAPSNSERVYAIIEAEEGGLFRSDDAGTTWTRINEDRVLRQRAWYYHTLTVHPTNADVLYAPQVPMLKSIDGGRSFKTVGGFHHGDHHDLWIDPKNPDRMINSNDGGVDISTDGGKTWFAPPLPITQFYHVHADNSTPYRIMGCMQDLGSASGPSRSLKGSGISAGEWHRVGGGEAGHCVSDPSDPNIVYAGEYGGIMTRYDHRTGQARNITVNQWNPSGIDPEKHKYRFQWTAPIFVSSHDPKVVYHCGNYVFRTKDGGQTWEKVSPDLTRDDKKKQQWSGGPITGDNTGAETYCTIFAFAESPKKAGLLWAGSDDGLVHLSTDNGKTWTNLTPNIPDLPDWGTVTCIEPSPHDENSAFLVVDNHRMDDYRPHVWKTTDLGKTWTKIVETLDAATHAKVVREDPKQKDLLYLGTERGIQYSTNSGKTWNCLQLNLPTVPVHDLQVKGDDLVVGTHGRSLWILDQLTAVRQWSKDIEKSSLHVYPVLPVTKYETGGAIISVGRDNITRNPDSGAVLWYWLNPETRGELKLEILNSQGEVIARGKGDAQGEGTADEDEEPSEDEDDEDDQAPTRKLPANPGLNKFVWDLTHDGATSIPGAKVDAGNPSMGIPVSPGIYTAKLTLGKETLDVKVEVNGDPRLAKPSSNAQETLALKVRDQITTLSETVERIRVLNKQIGLHKSLLKGNDAAKDLLKAQEELGKKLTNLEEKLHNPKAKVVYDIFGARGGAMLYSQLVWLLGNVTDGVGEPTKPQLELSADLTKRLNELVAAFDTLASKDLKTINEMAAKATLPTLYLPPLKKK